MNLGLRYKLRFIGCTNQLNLLMLIYFCFLTLCSTMAVASAPIKIKELRQTTNITPSMEVLEDPNHLFSFEKIRSSELGNGELDSQFHPVEQDVFIGSHVNSRYWFRFKFEWSDSAMALAEEPILFLSTTPSFIYQLQLQLTTANNGKTDIITGYREKFESRDIDDLHYAFNLHRQGQLVTEVVGMIDNGEINMPSMLSFDIVSSKNYPDLKNKIQAVQLVLYSAMAALFFYNLCLWFSLKEKVYGIYLLFVMSAVILCTSTDGTIDIWLLPDYPTERYRITTAVGILASMAYLAFVYNSLNRESFPKLLEYAYRYILWLGVACCIISIISPNHYYPSIASQIYPGFVLPVGLIFIFYGIMKGSTIAVFLFLAEMCTAAGGITYMLMMQGNVPVNRLTYWSLHLGFLTESLMLSLALAARTRDLQNQAIYNLQKYEKLYEESIEGLFQYFVKDRKLKANPKLSGLLKIADIGSEAVNFDIFTAMSEDNARILGQLVNNQDVVAGYELPLVATDDAEPTWISLTMRNIRDDKGQIERIDGSMIDITERKLREKAQREALNNLRRADEIKNEFLATVSHELRTPMNGILGNIELLEDQGIVNENTEHLARSAAEMMYLVDSILNYAQLQAGNLQADRSLFSIKSVIEPLAIFIRSRCDKKGIKFTLEILSDPPEEVWGDKQKIQKILEILLSNAVRFTADGEVRLVVDSLRTRAREDQRSPVYSILFNVMDTGQGISIEDRQKLFRPFSQTDGSFKRQHGGLGLGLATCQRFAQLMRGTLLFISEINAGSQFNFIIDLEAVETVSKLTEAKTPSSTNVAAERDKTKILIVEDNITNQMVLQGMLKKLGFASITAENGLRALEILQTNSFDLILMDCQMPEMDGFETTQQIRKTCNGQAAVPIIAVTANAMDGDREKCLRAGMNDYMKKPINRDLLEAMLERWIP